MQPGKQQQGGPGGAMDQLTPEQLAEMLYRALMNADEAMMRALARQAVSRYAGMEPGRPVGGTYYLYRTLRNLDLDGMLEKLMDAARQEVGGDMTALEERLERDEFETRIEQLKKEIEAEIRRRLVADRGVEAMAKTLRKPLPEDVDFMHASRDEMAALRRALYPLTRKLAVRLARKRRHGRKGPLDFRNTVRHSLSYGGVPAEPKFRYPRPAKPEIMVVADISGSVAAFARFTLHLVYAISGQFSKVRAFVFIDGIDEVTSYFEGVEDITEAVHRVNTEADVVWVDGHSDYGHALEVFWEKWGREVGPKTTVILLGDARNNYHAAQSLGAQGDASPRAPRLLAEPRARARTGTPATRSSGSTASTPTACSSAATCASSSDSSRTSPELGGVSPRLRPPRRIAGLRRPHRRRADRVQRPLRPRSSPSVRAARTTLHHARARPSRPPRRQHDAACAARRPRSSRRRSAALPCGRTKRFCERHPGEADGMSYDDAIAKYGYDDFEDDPSVALSPGGETWIDFHERVATAVRRVAAEHPDHTVVIACHAGVIDAAIRGLLDLPMVGGFELFTQNTALSELVLVPARDRRSERWRLVRYNDAAHLAGVG